MASDTGASHNRQYPRLCRHRASGRLSNGRQKNPFTPRKLYYQPDPLDLPNNRRNTKSPHQKSNNGTVAERSDALSLSKCRSIPAVANILVDFWANSSRYHLSFSRHLHPGYLTEKHLDMWHLHVILVSGFVLPSFK